jgi:hypothetical protein
MSTSTVDRRAQRHQNAFETGLASEVVRLALTIQRDTGTVSAIEFLKSNGFGSAVIQRVLSRASIRAEDLAN